MKTAFQNLEEYVKSKDIENSFDLSKLDNLVDEVRKQHFSTEENKVGIKLIQDEEFTIKIVSFLKASASEQLQTIIKEAHFYTEVSYKDNEGEEDLIGLSALEELTELAWINDTTKEELKHIRALMDSQDACYFRLI